MPAMKKLKPSIATQISPGMARSYGVIVLNLMIMTLAQRRELKI
ncbi:MAG: hypothetical protein RLZZ419_736 [Pseudomonadota bacterium]|jgi:hypothetical protein